MTTSRAMLRALSASMTDGSSLTREDRKRLKAAAASHQARTSLFLDAVATHRAARLARVAQAMDLTLQHLTSPQYVAALKNDPKALTRHALLLQKLEESDVDFLQKRANGSRSGVNDPVAQVNALVQVANVENPVADVSVRTRRTLQSVLRGVSHIFDGQGTKRPPPSGIDAARRDVITRLTTDGPAD